MLKHFKHQNMIHDVSLRSISNSSSECLSECCSRYHHWETNKLNFSDQCQTKFLLPKSQNEFYDLLTIPSCTSWSSWSSSTKTKAKGMENGLIFHVTIQIQILTMFSVQSKYSKKTKSISLLGFVISNKTCKTWNVQTRCQPSRLSSSSRRKRNSLLPTQKRSMDSSHHRCQIFTSWLPPGRSTCLRTCCNCNWEGRWRRPVGKADGSISSPLFRKLDPIGQKPIISSWWTQKAWKRVIDAKHCRSSHS